MTDYDPNYKHQLNYFIVGTKTILQNKEGRTLILKRTPDDKGISVSKWSFPGGALNKNEDPLSAARREIEEETKLKIEILNVFAINFHSHDEKPTVIIGYKGKFPEDQEVELNWEHSEYKFLSKEEALK